MLRSSNHIFIERERSVPLRTKRERLIYLHQTSMNRKMLSYLQRHDPTLQSIFTMKPAEISGCFGLTAPKALHLHQEIHSNELQRRYERLPAVCTPVTIYDMLYPPALQMIPDPPPVLYTLGKQELLRYAPSISVIGTRKPSDSAIAKLTFIVTPLLQQDWLIVSGLAYGIDAMAHDLTVRHSGKTIAVLGGGFQHLYPQRHLPLFQEIVRHGLVISEYPPDVPPRKHHFPERNRIISGLSLGTLVIEATEKSGTLITVDQALEQGKEVYAVPGSPLIEQTAGCHRIIQQGAKLVMEAADILEDWPLQHAIQP